jgi:hypothetical protein
MWRQAPDGGAAVTAAWAACRGASPGLAAETADRALARAGAVGGAHVLSAGLLAAARGDLEGARRLIASIAWLAPPQRPGVIPWLFGGGIPRPVRVLAHEWLTVQDAADGRWDAIARRAGRQPTTRTVRLLESLAAAAAPHASPASAAATSTASGLAAKLPRPPRRLLLWLHWLLAPHRRATLPLVRAARISRTVDRAKASGAGADSPATAIASAFPDSADPLADPSADALRAHLATLARAAAGLSADDLGQLGAAWDRALGDPGPRLHAMERAVALGHVADAGRALTEIRAAVVADLIALARHAALPIGSLPDSSPIVVEAARQLRHQLLAELELAFGALADRRAAGRALPALDEWRALLAIRAAYDEAVTMGGLDLRRLAFPHAYSELQPFACDLWNQREERLLANALFRWLREEAQAVGDAAAVEVLEQNCRVNF